MVSARTLVTGSCLAALGYAGYAAATDSGPYRWLIALKIRWLGSHDSSWTFAILALVLCTLAALTAGLLSRALGLRKDAAPLSQRAQRAIALVAGVVFTGAGVASAVHASSVADGEVAYEPLDLAAPSAPRGRHVEIVGVAQDRWGVRIRQGTSAVDYVPLTAPGWQPDAPVTYFGKLSLEDAARGARLSTRGLLVEDGVPSLACAGFAKRGLRLASPVFLIDSDTHAEMMPWVAAAIVCGTLALACLCGAILGGRRVQARRRQ